MSCLRAAHILSKTLSGVGCVMAALLTSSSVRYLAARGSETFISVWFSAKYCAMIPPLSVKLAAGFLIRIPVFVTKALPVNFKKRAAGFFGNRSEEHTSELQSRFDLVCRLLLEKKNIEHMYTFFLDAQSDMLSKNI